uniref:Uncharacterized protein n=1 Tax=Panagrolaimus sp. JU765 TaxID=591449 RepID=A0AC34Q5S5_9BILA
MNESAPNSVRLPDIIDPSESLLRLNQLRQNLYLLLRTIENDRSSEETLEQSKVVANSLSSFKKETALLPVVSGTREHQNKRIAQLRRAIALKNIFYKRLLKRRPSRRTRKQRRLKKLKTKRKKPATRWVKLATLKARKKRQMDIFQGGLSKAPKIEEDDDNDNPKKKKIYLENDTKIPRVWRLKKKKTKKRKSKKIKNKNMKVETETKPKKSVAKSSTKPKKRKDKKSPKKKKKTLRRPMAFDAPAKFLENKGYENKYKNLFKLRQLLIRKGEENLIREVKEIDKKRRKMEEGSEKSKNEVNWPTTKWNYFRPNLMLEKPATIPNEDEPAVDCFARVKKVTLSNAHVDSLREEKLIEPEMDAPNTVIKTRNFDVSELRISRQPLTFPNIDPDLAGVFNEMDLI